MQTSSWTTPARLLQGQKFPRERQFWQKTEVLPEIQVTATNIRKWFVNVCHRKMCEGADFDESVLWRAMCHSDRVAQSDYLQDNLAEAHDIIAMCTNQTPLEEDPLNIEEPQEDPGNIQSDNKKDSNTRPLTALQKKKSNASLNRKSWIVWSVSPSVKNSLCLHYGDKEVCPVHIRCYRRNITL